MGLYVKLEAEYASDPKILAAGCHGELLFVRSLALAKRTLSDGFISNAQLSLLCLGLPGKASKHAEALVAAGLWVSVDGGWCVVQWGKHNAMRAEVEAMRARKAEAAAKGNHDRWHKHDSAMPTCALCDAEGWLKPRKPVAKGSQTDRTVRSPSDTTASPEPEPEPEPYPYPNPYPEPYPNPEPLGCDAVCDEDLTKTDQSLERRASHDAEPRPRNLLFDALTEHAEGINPHEPIGQRKARAIGVATAEIQKLGGTPEQVPQAVANFRKQFSGATVTANAIATHWARLKPQTPKQTPTRAELFAAAQADETRKALANGVRL